MCRKWERNFEIEFKNLLKKPSNNETKIIIGQEPYKNKLNNIDFCVTNKKEPYGKIDNTVAFFVFDWMKIQDSLEMIFNLLFNGNINSLKVLIFLRKYKVPAKQFADYLYKRYKLILTNIRNKGKDNSDRINKLIHTENNFVYLLLLGNISYAKMSNNKEVKEVIHFIHPSGVNIQNNPEQYFSDWYEYKEKSENLEKFRVFK